MEFVFLNRRLFLLMNNSCIVWHSVYFSSLPPTEPLEDRRCIKIPKTYLIVTSDIDSRSEFVLSPFISLIVLTQYSQKYIVVVSHKIFMANCLSAEKRKRRLLFFFAPYLSNILASFKTFPRLM